MCKTARAHFYAPAFLLGVFLLLFPIGATAHPYGNSFEKQINGVLIDIGYNVTDFTAGSSAVFEFELRDGEEMAEFDDVWVRIAQGTKTVLATGIHNASFGGARMTYVFPSRGSYELHVRYQAGSEGVAEAVFPIEVLPNPNKRETGGGVVFFAGIFSGLVAGFLGARFLARR